MAEDLPEGMSLRDMGEHALKDLARRQRLYQVVTAELPADFPALRSLATFPTNLPIQLSSFIGRERELAEVKGWLSRTRLLTLIGSGGAGKTRLALQAAAELLEVFSDGAWLVEFAPLSDGRLIPRTVASVLNIAEHPGREILATLSDYLKARNMLLILDNCEHLVKDCAYLIEMLLQHCPDLRILATSREALGVPGETTWRVPSLSVPDPRQDVALADLMEYEAVRLFVERAQAAQPAFVLTKRNGQAVARICQQLDGIPLALEFAAVRVRSMSVEQIATRLDDRFRLLTGGSRTSLPRQQTLRAALDWSHGLLSDKERVLLRRLSVFAGGWTLEPAEAVCAGGDMEESEVLDLLTHLIDKSLVMLDEEAGEARYRLLETVRQYAQEKLVEAGEAEAVRGRHRDFFLALAERADPELRRPNQAVWLNRLEVEHDNLRAALAWSRVGQDGAQAGLRLAGALHWFWWQHGYFSEGSQWLEEALSRSAGTSAAARATALNGAGLLTWRKGDFARAGVLVRDGLTLSRELGDKSGMAYALHHLAHLAEQEGDGRAVVALFEESLALYGEAKDRWGLALSSTCFAEALRSQGDYGRATRVFEDSVDHATAVGNLSALGNTYKGLATLARIEGDYTRAMALHQQSLSISQGIGHKLHMAESLAGLAAVASAQNMPERAARLYGVAESLREQIGGAVAPADRADYEQNVRSVRDALGEKLFAAAWAEGRAMALERAIEYALSNDPLEGV